MDAACSISRIYIEHQILQCLLGLPWVYVSLRVVSHYTCYQKRIAVLLQNSAELEECLDASTRRIRPPVTLLAECRSFFLNDYCSLVQLQEAGISASQRAWSKVLLSRDFSRPNRHYNMRFECPPKWIGSLAQTAAWSDWRGLPQYDQQSCSQYWHLQLMEILSIWAHHWLETAYARLNTGNWKVWSSYWREHKANILFPIFKQQASRPEESPKYSSFDNNWFTLALMCLDKIAIYGA